MHFCNISIRPYCRECNWWLPVNFGGKTKALLDLRDRQLKACVDTTNMVDLKLLTEKDNSLSVFECTQKDGSVPTGMILISYRSGNIYVQPDDRLDIAMALLYSLQQEKNGTISK